VVIRSRHDLRRGRSSDGEVLSGLGCAGGGGVTVPLLLSARAASQSNCTCILDSISLARARRLSIYSSSIVRTLWVNSVRVAELAGNGDASVAASLKYRIASPAPRNIPANLASPVEATASAGGLHMSFLMLDMGVISPWDGVDLAVRVAAFSATVGGRAAWIQLRARTRAPPAASIPLHFPSRVPRSPTLSGLPLPP